jgi:ABC-type phosphate transport system permease subunit
MRVMMESGNSAEKNKTKNSNQKMLVAAIVIAFVIPICIMAWVLAQPQRPPPERSTGPQLGIRAEKTGENWTISVTGGSFSPNSLTMQVINTSTGALIISHPISVKETADLLYNDNNANRRFDAGDSIILKSAAGHIESGNKIQFMQGGNIIGTIRELP